MGSCFVAIAPDADIIAAGATHWLVMRHEMGHCNGWRGHSGARSWLAELPFAPDHVVERAVTDTAAQFDNFASSAVGKTVAEAASNLAQGNENAAAQFVLAAKSIGLAPELRLTGQVCLKRSAHG